jgi:uncharacterized phage protein (TIGR02220 family)
MNTGQIIKSRLTDKFTVISNEISRSKELNLEEKGLLVFLLSLPSDWVLYKSNLHDVLNETEYKISKAFKGLQDKKYIISVKMIDNESHKFIGWNHVIHDEPVSDTQITDNQPRHEIPKVGTADIRKITPILNTNNITKKEDTTKDYTSFLFFLNQTLKKNYRGDSKSKVSFKNRLKEGFTLKDIEYAIKSIAADPFHRDNQYKYATPEFILRPDKLDRFLNMKTEQQTITTQTNAAFF